LFAFLISACPPPARNASQREAGGLLSRRPALLPSRARRTGEAGGDEIENTKSLREGGGDSSQRSEVSSQKGKEKKMN